MRKLLNFYRNKRVFLTGHTGFKGAWLSELLLGAGAEVCGYALPYEEGGLFDQLCLAGRMRSITGDMRDLEHLQQIFQEYRPEFVFHLAAQALVRRSYQDPVETYSTNVMGTVHLLECVRTCAGVRSVVNVTTDKVYRNLGKTQAFQEDADQILDGYEPYSNSKSCSELVTGAYIRSFLKAQGIAVSTARAGNVIGGGDTAADRILPDCVRAVRQGRAICVRNPHSVRPYQHVLEPLSAYLLIAKAQYESPEKAGAYNVGPALEDCLTTGELAERFCRCWGEGARWLSSPDGGPQEAECLRLDCRKIESALGWTPRWRAKTAVEKTVDWTKAVLAGESAAEVTQRQIQEYFGTAPVSGGGAA